MVFVKCCSPSFFACDVQNDKAEEEDEDEDEWEDEDEELKRGNFFSVNAEE